MKENYPVFVHWMDCLDWILSTVDRFPKSIRGTVSNRIVDLSLDVVEAIVGAIYRRERANILDDTNIYIEKLRVMFRICHRRRYLTDSQYEHVSALLNETGRMLGGWRKGV